MADLPRSVEWSTSVYRTLLHAYPTSFRAAFGDEMVLVFHEMAIDAWNQNGAIGLAEVWRRFGFAFSLIFPDRFLNNIIQSTTEGDFR